MARTRQHYKQPTPSAAKSVIKSLNYSLKEYRKTFGEGGVLADFESRIMENVESKYLKFDDNNQLQGIKITKQLMDNPDAVKSLLELQDLDTPAARLKHFSDRAKEEGLEMPTKVKDNSGKKIVNPSLVEYANSVTTAEIDIKENLQYAYDESGNTPVDSILHITGRRKTWDELRIVQAYVSRAMQRQGRPTTTVQQAKQALGIEDEGDKYGF